MEESLKRLLKNSYSPYSNFKVASICLMKDGKSFGGVNVENASFGATICAERVAITNECGKTDTLYFCDGSSNISDSYAAHRTVPKDDQFRIYPQFFVLYTLCGAGCYDDPVGILCNAGYMGGGHRICRRSRNGVVGQEPGGCGGSHLCSCFGSGIDAVT